MSARQLVERELDERLIGVDAALRAEQTGELGHRPLAIAVSPDDARRAIERVYLLALLVVNDGLVTNGIDEHVAASSFREVGIGMIHKYSSRTNGRAPVAGYMSSPGSTGYTVDTP